jgi:hypothetical protein
MAIACEPSVLPLSATTTSPAMPCSRNARAASSTQSARVSASFRQGMSTVSSIGSIDAADDEGIKQNGGSRGESGNQ